MAPTLDATTAKETALRLWLAAQPCPGCGGVGVHEYGDEKESCGSCWETGRAFPWASEKCDSEWHKDVNWRALMALGGLQCPRRCENGRVPKVLGLADIILAVPYGVWSFVAGEDDWFCTLTIYNPNGDEEADPQVSKGTDPDLTLAALRAVVAQAQVGMEAGR